MTIEKVVALSCKIKNCVSLLTIYIMKMLVKKSNFTIITLKAQREVQYDAKLHIKER